MMRTVVLLEQAHQEMPVELIGGFLGSRLSTLNTRSPVKARSNRMNCNRCFGLMCWFGCRVIPSPPLLAFP